MKNWTIGKRITVGFAVMLAVSLGLGLFACSRIRAIQHESYDVIQNGIPSLELLGGVQARLKENDGLVYRHIWCPDDKEMHTLQAQIEANIDANGKALDAYEKVLSDDHDRASFEKTKDARAKFHDAIEKILAASYAATNTALSKLVYDRATAELLPASDAYEKAIQECLGNETNSASDSAVSIGAVTRNANVGIAIGIISALMLGSVLAVVIIRGISRTLSQVTGSLNDGSNQVASAAGQVSASSQTLAEGASEQAASIEESSASLEEMSSMIKRNAENAQKANELAKQARTVAERGTGNMQTMSSAMQSIKASSDDIAKIIKTIDEIAFQTNILALNAAVEAARAGEAGMGFAVVADEVRNLAQRSAQAAKETAAKIEGAISNTSQGVQISSQVAEVLNDIVSKVRQVDDLIAEVSGASREQTQGIAQINLAVGQMDKITQSNAANAEESAAAAEELNAQAVAMKQSVGELQKMVSGTSTNPGNGFQSPAYSAPALKSPAKPHANGKARISKPLVTRPVAPVSAGARRNEIPMDGDFKDF